MPSFVHVPAAAVSWTKFAVADATHEQLAGLSDAVASDAVWLVRRDVEANERVAPSQAGLYKIPVGEFEFESPGDEMCYVLAGEADIKVSDGRSVQLSAGDMVFWPRGTRTNWSVSAEFVQFFTMIG